MFHRLRKIETNIKTMKREIEDTKKDPMELLKVKNAIFEIKKIYCMWLRANQITQKKRLVN